MQYTDGDLGEALGKAFVKEAFGPQAKADTLKMVHEVESDAREGHQQPRLDDGRDQEGGARQASRRSRTRSAIRISGATTARCTIVRGDALGNSQRSNAFEFHRQLNKIGKPVDKTEWSMTPPTVNAYYNPLENNINFPAGILQPPFYSAKADAAVNYGGAGAVIGHELTHGFDDQGRQFDARGNLKDWWTPADAKAFEQRAQCFVDQYSSYTAVDDVKLNGKLTLGENTADNGGLRIALMAYLATLGGRAAEDARRLHARAARVPRLGAGLVREPPARARAHAGADQPALAGPLPRERRRVEHAGVPEGVLVQGRTRRWCGRTRAGSGECAGR